MEVGTAATPKRVRTIKARGADRADLLPGSDVFPGTDIDVLEVRR